MSELTLAHGVGRLYESPIPVWLYLVGAAATVLVSFAVGALVHNPGGPEGHEQSLAGEKVARALIRAVRFLATAALALTFVYAFLESEPGFSAAPLLFWTGLIVGTTIACSLIGGLWHEANPWHALEEVYRPEEHTEQPRTPPQWLGPLLVYALFWFELVSGRGFDPLAIALVLLGYTLFVLTLRPLFGARWDETDPLAILFGFASRLAPLRIDRRGLYRRNPVGAVVENAPMGTALFASLFIILGSTTLDNVRETVEWDSALDAVGLGNAPAMVVDSVALILFVVPFLLPYLLAVAIARVQLPASTSVMHSARLFAWSLIPIAIVYVLAHNLPLFMMGVPQLIQELGETVGITAFERYSPSPRLVWFLEVALIVGGHVLGVLAAHRVALRESGERRAALLSHLPLTVLMSGFTILTLWLLSLPLVTG